MCSVTADFEQRKDEYFLNDIKVMEEKKNKKNNGDQISNYISPWYIFYDFFFTYRVKLELL